MILKSTICITELGWIRPSPIRVNKQEGNLLKGAAVPRTLFREVQGPFLFAFLSFHVLELDFSRDSVRPYICRFSTNFVRGGILRANHLRSAMPLRWPWFVKRKAVSLSNVLFSTFLFRAQKRKVRVFLIPFSREGKREPSLFCALFTERESLLMFSWKPKAIYLHAISDFGRNGDIWSPV